MSLSLCLKALQRFVVLFLSIQSLFAAYTITGNDDPTFLGKHIESFEDATGALTFDALRTQQFAWQKINAESPNFGYTNAAVWLRLRVQNNDATHTKHLLEVGYPLLDRVEFYQPTANGYAQTTTGG